MTEANTVELGAEYFQDPYSAHERLRAQRPVSRVILPGGDTPVWLITRYAEVRAALADPRLSKSAPGWHPDPDSIFGALDMHMLNSDPPDHGRLRRLVNKAFTVRRVEELRPRITAITAALLDEISAEREVDLLASFAFPLPITVICELLGIPVADRDDFRDWSSTIVSDTATPAAYEAAATAMVRSDSAWAAGWSNGNTLSQQFNAAFTKVFGSSNPQYQMFVVSNPRFVPVFFLNSVSRIGDLYGHDGT